MRRLSASLAAAVLLAACGGGGDAGGGRGNRGGATTPPPASASGDDGLPGATTHPIESISVHTLTWLSADEVLTVEFPDATTGTTTPTWLVVDVTSGAVRQQVPPATPGCPAATATGPARTRDGVVAYAEHCPQPKRSRVLSLDLAAGAARPVVVADLPGVEIEHVTAGADGKPAYVGGLTGPCAGIGRLAGGRLDPRPLPVPAVPGWDLAAPLRENDCARRGRAAFVRVSSRGGVAFVGSPPGTPGTRLYVSAPGRFDPKPVGPELTSPADLVWSADGKAIYVTSREGPLLGLARIDVATGKATRLYERSVLSLALSPDGTRLAVLRPRPTTTALYVLKI